MRVGKKLEMRMMKLERQIEESDADLIIIYSTLWQHYWPPDSGRSQIQNGFWWMQFPRFR